VGGRVRGITGHSVESIGDDWALASCPPGALEQSSINDTTLDWIPCPGPMTAAAALRAADRWNLDAPPRRFDAEDWWYRGRFAAPAPEAGEQLWLCFDGLATIADVWLNGQPLLTAVGMFTAHERRVDALLRADNELLIHFHALDTALSARRPRPRWRAPMIEHQQLRWFRTTLLGRTPGWSPPAAPVGPWRPVRLERRRGVMVRDVRIAATGHGVLDLACHLEMLDGATPAGVSLMLDRDGRSHTIPLTGSAGAGQLAGRLTVPDVEQWWPHTHGTPALYAARLDVKQGRGVSSVDLGSVGFRDVTLDHSERNFAIAVNGAPVFCRGACWTPLDPVSFENDPAQLEQAFDQVTDAGMNMLRVGGTMVYETDAFLDACDRRGVLLWQDFMFANMDYPADDPGFMAQVTSEAGQQLARFQGRPSLAILCGNSEGEQQAAMWGAERARWAPELFHTQLPAMAAELVPGTPYWPSSAHGGTFPHQGSAGSTSYYGVGAYLRPLEDARRAEVRFASECLAFANVPEERSLAAQPGGLGIKVHQAEWQARSPRDLGAGWDFDDVRDHYLGRLFGVDPLALRYGDHDRYLALSRVVTGEVMAQTFGEWRRMRSPTGGGLIWFLRDLWPGAGWGVVDATGLPKAAWHYLRRSMAPVALHLSDEGGNGIGVHLANDTADAVTGDLTLTLWRAGEVRVGSATRPITIPPRGALELNAGDLFDEFRDLSYAYRFGPASHDVVAAELRTADGRELARSFWFVGGWPSTRELDVGLGAQLLAADGGAYRLTVATRRFAQSVQVDVEHFDCSDNYFHLQPGESRVLALTPQPGAATEQRVPRGTVRALNSEAAAKVSPA